MTEISSTVAQGNNNTNEPTKLMEMVHFCASIRHIPIFGLQRSPYIDTSLFASFLQIMADIAADKTGKKLSSSNFTRINTLSVAPHSPVT